MLWWNDAWTERLVTQQLRSTCVCWGRKQGFSALRRGQCATSIKFPVRAVSRVNISIRAVHTPATTIELPQDAHSHSSYAIIWSRLLEGKTDTLERYWEHSCLKAVPERTWLPFARKLYRIALKSERSDQRTAQTCFAAIISPLLSCTNLFIPQYLQRTSNF